ncbi:MAG TPA: TrkA family potassium uptake protein, partial [Marmoricola sp.]|nr:TrkA family potassium uptake protein [Marmoricola sp.]
DVLVPAVWVAKRSVIFQEQSRSRIAWIDRLGEGMLPSRETVLQEGDVLHLVHREEDADHVFDVIKRGPEVE